MSGETTRRVFLRSGTLATAGLVAAEASATGQDSGAQNSQANGSTADYARDRPTPGGPVGSATDRGMLVPGLRALGEPPVPVIVPDVTEKLAWSMVDGAKEFHLRCQHTPREMLPGLHIDTWGFNGSMPGPTIELTQGDRVRFWVHNDLPESTAVHWHGLELPAALDGVPFVIQDPIPPGGSQAYEFTLHQSGTCFYHSHDAMQEGIGMVGLIIIHPRVAHEPRVDRDFALVLQEWAILPGSTIPNTMSMEFNLFTINGRAAPYITPLVCKLGERVRIRMLNFSAIDHHPMHLHGVTFFVTGTEGGRVQPSAWVPGNTVLIGVAQVREIEFVANNPGDWVLHCHMFHHVMNFMSSMIGPMGGHTTHGLRAGQSAPAGIGIVTQGPALSESFGPSLGRALGEQIALERAVGNGPGATRSARAGRAVPGYPQGMLDMHMNMPEGHLQKLRKRETRGMREHWYKGMQGLMSVVRILPPDLYEQVMTGQGDVPHGASVPGETGVHHHQHPPGD